jgi:hypothetical protein
MQGKRETKPHLFSSCLAPKHELTTYQSRPSGINFLIKIREVFLVQTPRLSCVPGL